MTQLTDYAAQLVRDVGSRPAASDGEQMAANIIADHMVEMGLDTKIEEFNSPTAAGWVRAMYLLLAAFAAAIVFFAPALAILSLVLAIIALAALVTDLLNINPLFGMFGKGASQNVVGRYVPSGEYDRRRKVIVVAHYDAGRTAVQGNSLVVRYAVLLRKVAWLATLVLFLAVVLSLLPLPDIVAQLPGILCLVTGAICLLAALITILDNFMPYYDGSNSNASGVAALMGVAEMLAGIRETRVGFAETSGFAGGANAAEAFPTLGTRRGQGADRRKSGSRRNTRSSDATSVVSLSGAGGAGKSGDFSAQTSFASTTSGGLSGATTDLTDDNEKETLGMSLSHLSESERNFAPELRVGKNAIRPRSERQTRDGLAVEATEPQLAGDVALSNTVHSNTDLSNTDLSNTDLSNTGFTNAAQTSLGLSGTGFAGAGRSGTGSLGLIGTGTSSSTGSISNASSVTGTAGFGVLSDNTANNEIVDPNVPAWFASAKKKAAANVANAANAANSAKDSQGIAKKQEKQTSRSQFADVPVGVATGIPRNLTKEGSKDKDAILRRALQDVSRGKEEVKDVEKIEHSLKSAISNIKSDAPKCDSETAVAGAPSAFATDTTSVSSVSVSLPRPTSLASTTAAPGLQTHEPYPTINADLSGIDRHAISVVGGSIENSGYDAIVPPVEVNQEQAEQPVLSAAASEQQQLQQQQLRLKQQQQQQQQAGLSGLNSHNNHNDFNALNGLNITNDINEPQDFDDSFTDRTLNNTSYSSFLDDDIETNEIYEAGQAGNGFNQEPFALDIRSEAQALLNNENKNVSRSEQLRNIPAIVPLESGVLPTQQPTLEDDFVPATDYFNNDDTLTGKLGGATGSFAPLGATGTFAPVSDELLRYHDDSEDIYLDDADDSTLVGSGSGKGYVMTPHMAEMPTSRARTFFSNIGDRLSGRKKREELEDSPSSWLGVGDDYDARKAGGKIGSWSNFGNDDVGTSDAWQGASGGVGTSDAWQGASGGTVARGDSLDGWTNYDTDDDDFVAGNSGWNNFGTSDDDFAAGNSGWNNFGTGDDSWDRYDDDDEGWKGGAYGGDSYEDDIAAVASASESLIDKEVWLVATGSQEAEGFGIRSLIAKHKNAMRGAIVINLDSVGAGELCYTTSEGVFRSHKTDQRLQGLAASAANILGLHLEGVRFSGYLSDAGWALSQGIRAISLIGLDHDFPAVWRNKADRLSVLQEEQILQASEIAYEMIKSS
ncbi:MAG: M28 family peptidase [Coriobacteriales bacterium]|jgi:hypothetical protein|nr:M28 family peptidase [Coriobacteriales bacterium]